MSEPFARYRRGESDFRSHVVRQARGIVLEKETNRIVSWAFDKFYEYGEDAPTYKEERLEVVRAEV